MTHYELFFFFQCGFRPKDVVGLFGYSRATAYRAHTNYRKARIQAQKVIRLKKSVSLNRENRANNLDDLT